MFVCMTLPCGRDVLMGACLNLSCAIKNVFGFKRSDSVTQILLQLGLPSLNTLIYSIQLPLGLLLDTRPNSRTLHTIP